MSSSTNPYYSIRAIATRHKIATAVVAGLVATHMAPCGATGSTVSGCPCSTGTPPTGFSCFRRHPPTCSSSRRACPLHHRCLLRTSIRIRSAPLSAIAQHGARQPGQSCRLRSSPRIPQRADHGAAGLLPAVSPWFLQPPPGIQVRAGDLCLACDLRRAPGRDLHAAARR
jgi:hypothetical protein